MAVLETLDEAAIRRWCAAALAGFRRHQDEIDELNVYPVPDGDTGTNLALTMAAAEEALAAADQALAAAGGALAAAGGALAAAGGALAAGAGRLAAGGNGARPDGETPHGRALRIMARGALMGARGNSGVILSQVFRGLTDTLSGVPAVGGRALATALRAAATAAYAAVAKPVEGTMLTVATAAADGATGADTDELSAVVTAATTSAADALRRTPEMLPELARAGVVDAGGRGLVVLLDALCDVVDGREPGRDTGAPGQVARPAPTVAQPAPLTRQREMGSLEYAYEVQYLLEAEDDAVGRLKETLGRLGDSLVVVGSGHAGGETPIWNVHIHVNDIGGALEAGIVAGRPHRVSVTRFDDQIRAADARATVVVATGEGLVELFAGEGAVVVRSKPSTAELLAAIRSTAAGRVVVLPNDPNTQPVAAAAATEAHASGVRVRVVPTRSPVQAIASLAVRDAGRPFEDDVIAMAEAAGACRYAEVCFASREALTVAGQCRPGDVLALVDGEVNLIGFDLKRTCRDLVDRMLGGGGELVTLLTGADAPADLAPDLEAHLARAWPFVEVQTFAGGQPFYPLLVGVE